MQFKKGHNRQLVGLLNQVEDIAQKASKEDDFKKLFKLLKDFVSLEGPIQFDNSARYWFAFWVFAFAVFFTIACFKIPAMSLAWQYWYISYGIILIIFICPFFLAGSDTNTISEISHYIMQKDIVFDNGLSRQKIESKTGLYHDFHRRFGEFRDRGDEDRYISTLFAGNAVTKEFCFSFQYYIFHYVVVTYVTVPVKVGKVTTTVTHKVKTPYWRYGVNLDFGFTERLAIISSGGSYNYAKKWETASTDFNKVFNVYCDDEMTASKFLKPAVVLAFLDIAQCFDELNVEVNGGGQMNIAFSDDNLLESAGRRYSIAEPEKFENEIFSFLAVPKLDKLIKFVETLKKYNDFNF